MVCMSLPVMLWRQDQPQSGLTSTPVAAGVSPTTSTDWLLSALVPPVLVGLLVSRSLADALVQVGLVSEQLLQGERLPNLNIHQAATDGDEF